MVGTHPIAGVLGLPPSSMVRVAQLHGRVSGNGPDAVVLADGVRLIRMNVRTSAVVRTFEPLRDDLLGYDMVRASADGHLVAQFGNIASTDRPGGVTGVFGDPDDTGERFPPSSCRGRRTTQSSVPTIGSWWFCRRPSRRDAGLFGAGSPASDDDRWRYAYVGVCGRLPTGQLLSPPPRMVGALFIGDQSSGELRVVDPATYRSSNTFQRAIWRADRFPFWRRRVGVARCQNVRWTGEPDRSIERVGRVGW